MSSPWIVAWLALGASWLVWLPMGRTPVVEGLFGLAVVAGLLGHVVDWAKR